MALRDMRANRIDWAVVGGLNLIDEETTADLKRASFLSPTGRCHTFEVGEGFLSTNYLHLINQVTYTQVNKLITLH